MIIPIATFEYRCQSVSISFIKETQDWNEFYDFRVEVYRAGYNDARYDENYRRENTKTLKRATFLLDKYTDKPMGDIKKFLDGIILGLARNNFDDKNKCSVLCLVKEGEKLYTKPYNIEPHLGHVLAEPISLELKKNPRVKDTGKVPKYINIGTKVTCIDPDFDKAGNSLEKEFTCNICLSNKEDGEYYQYEDFDRGRKPYCLYDALLSTLSSTMPCYNNVELFAKSYKPKEDKKLDKNVLKNMLLRWDGFKDRKEEIERFFQPEPEAEEINLNHSL